jgi:hypothetical protein
VLGLVICDALILYVIRRMRARLVGDFGVLILVGAVIGAVWLNRRLMRSGPDEPRPSVAGGQAPAV